MKKISLNILELSIYLLGFAYPHTGFINVFVAYNCFVFLSCVMCLFGYLAVYIADDATKDKFTLKVKSQPPITLTRRLWCRILHITTLLLCIFIGWWFCAISQLLAIIFLEIFFEIDRQAHLS